MSTNWWAYVQQVAVGQTMASIARTAGVPQPSLSRWRDGVHPSPDSIRAFALAYGRPILEAYVAAGLLLEEEIADVTMPADVRALPTDALLGELGRRAGGSATSDQLVTREKESEPDPRKMPRKRRRTGGAAPTDPVLLGRMADVDNTPGLSKAKREELKRQLSDDYHARKR